MSKAGISLLASAAISGAMSKAASSWVSEALSAGAGSSPIPLSSTEPASDGFSSPVGSNSVSEHATSMTKRMHTERRFLALRCAMLLYTQSGTHEQTPPELSRINARLAKPPIQLMVSSLIDNQEYIFVVDENVVVERGSRHSTLCLPVLFTW